VLRRAAFCNRPLLDHEHARVETFWRDSVIHFESLPSVDCDVLELIGVLNLKHVLKILPNSAQSSIVSKAAQRASQKGKAPKEAKFSYKFLTHCCRWEGKTFRINNLRLVAGGGFEPPTFGL